ncbi:MAG: hypothetical protein ACREUL_18650 [Steroidobacteraceae bacterium]
MSGKRSSQRPAAARKRAWESLTDAEKRAWLERLAAVERARKRTPEETARVVEEIIAHMERSMRERRRPDKWRAKFHKTMDTAIKALEAASPLPALETWRAVCYLTAARDAYSPARKPKGASANYGKAFRRAQALAASGKTAVQIAAALTAAGLCGERTAYRYAKKARKS